MVGNFESDTHALESGWLLGLLLKHEIKAAPEMDGEDYTPVVQIDVPLGNGYVRQVRVKVLP